MQKTKQQNFKNVYFLNEEAKHHYLDTIAAEKLNEIEISTSHDFSEQFDDWVKDRTNNELLLIWAVLNEIEADTDHVPYIVHQQCISYAIPEWLALSGTLAFFSVHYLNKFLIEAELRRRGIEFGCYSTTYETAIITQNQSFTFERSLLQELKQNIYEDQLNKEYFTELADTITTMTLQ